MSDKENSIDRDVSIEPDGGDEPDGDNDEDMEFDERVERVSSGIKMSVKVKRGTDTRDQEATKLVAKGDSPEEVREDVELLKPALKDLANYARDI